MLATTVLALLLAQAMPAASDCPETPVRMIHNVSLPPAGCTLCKSGTSTGPGIGLSPSVGGMVGTPVFVMVTISADGSVAATSVVQSAGQALDARTIRLAQQSTYSPRTVNCKPVAGTYLFKVWWYGL